MKILLTTIFTTILLISSIQIGSAQRSHRAKKQGFIDLNLGIGLLSTYAKDKNAYATGMPLSASIDYRVHRNFSLGAYTGFSYSRGARVMNNSSSALEWENHTMVAGLRFAAQSNQAGNWEFYGGSATGLHMSRFKIMDALEKSWMEEHSPGGNNSRFYMTGFLGARFHLHKKLRLFSELGMGDSLLKMGASVRL